MISLTLPDGSRRPFDRPVSGAELAAAIGPGLAKAALAIKIDGNLKDLSVPIERDAKVEIVTRDHPDALELLRHDCAHVLAEAVQELYPGTQITFGPAIENGFYYDFARNEAFTPDDFAKIEQKMREIVERDEKITREIWSRDRAVNYFSDHRENFNAEWASQIRRDEDIS
jgi:threonyl-tRNA synthetase